MSIDSRDGEPDYIADVSTDIFDALRLVLLFYSAGCWDDAKQQEWLRISGTKEATTKALCDHIRSALAFHGAA